MDQESQDSVFHGNDDDRITISKWRRERLDSKLKQQCPRYQLYCCTCTLVRDFFTNINLMLIMQVVTSCILVLVCTRLEIHMASNNTFILQPIIFSLAFSLSSDFGRRDQVLESLGDFKTEILICYLSLFHWKKNAQKSNVVVIVDEKLRDLVFLVNEYLLTRISKKQEAILNVIDRNFSVLNDLFEKLRSYNLGPASDPHMSLLIHILQDLVLASEHMQNVRKYRSSRSIQSFNKIMSFTLPLLLSPYFAYLGDKSNSTWSPYFIAIVLTFMLASLQGVQDKLDDPFDNMGEDDVKIDNLDAWVKRFIPINRKESSIGQKVETLPPVCVKECLKRNAGTSKIIRKNTVVHEYKSCPEDLDKLSNYLEVKQTDLNLSNSKSYNFLTQSDASMQTDSLPYKKAMPRKFFFH